MVLRIGTVMRRRSLPQVVIPVPCHVDWNTMTRVDSRGRARFCGSCERPVYESASMTRDELFELIARHEGRRLPCVQLHRRPDGTIVTRDCFAPLVRVGRFLWVKVALAAVAFWAWALGIRPLARYVKESLNQARTTRASEDVIRGGMTIVTAPDDVPPFLDPARLASLPPPPPRAANTLIRPLLSEIDRAEPLRYLEADEEIRQRLEPDRHDRLMFMMDP